MKTTVEISTPLLERARRLAAREGTTLKALIERGLQRVIDEAQRPQTPGFRLRRASFLGRGLHPDAHDAPWSELRDRAYEGGGG
jgi:hypothetical protein